MASDERTSLRQTDKGLSGISETSVRHGFIQKVFGILSVQLTVTFVIAGLITAYSDQLVTRDPALCSTLIIVSSIVAIAMMFTFICCPHTMRESPKNYILLSIFTIAESVLVGFVCAQYQVQSVLIVLGVTAVIVTTLMGFACQTTYDFTGWMPYFVVFSMVLMCFGLILSLSSMFGASGPALQTMQLVYAALGSLLFSGYIVLDTQMIVGGAKNQKYKMSIDDYCMAAILLYVDIIQLFMFLLELFGNRR